MFMYRADISFKLKFFVLLLLGISNISKTLKMDDPFKFVFFIFDNTTDNKSSFTL